MPVHLMKSGHSHIDLSLKIKTVSFLPSFCISGFSSGNTFSKRKGDNAMNNDTISLLKECDSGTKTAVNSIKEVLDNTNSQKLLGLLTDNLREHESIGDEIHNILNKCGEKGKDPNPMARAMSWIKINVKMLEKPEDKNIAHLVFDGCSMGVKQLSEYLNKYSDADEESKTLAERLIRLEESLETDLKAYL